MGKRYRNRRGELVYAELNQHLCMIMAMPPNRKYKYLYMEGAWLNGSACQAALDAHAARMGWEEVTE